LRKFAIIENLYNAYLKARRGKNDVAEVLKFNYNLEDELLKLQQELKNQTYKTGEYRHFIIFEPKERKISALPFRDRIIHHAVCNIIEPVFERNLFMILMPAEKQKALMRAQTEFKNSSEKSAVIIMF